MDVIDPRPWLDRPAWTGAREALPGWVASGKVRELHAAGPRLVLLASDRLSAFDVVLPDGIPGKGVILTQLARLAFRVLAPLVRTHLAPDAPAVLEALFGPERAAALAPRATVARRLRPLPVESVARGYLAGSGWKEYRRAGALWGRPLPPGLAESAELPAPVFTPTTKAAAGHDEPLGPDGLAEIVGPELAARLEAKTLELYAAGRAWAARAGLLLADTKFEFALDDDGELVLIDEALTPDSSRYWPADAYRPGGPQPSFDKQFVRDYLETLAWDKRPPGPPLPPEVVRRTQQKYLEAFDRLRAVA